MNLLKLYKESFSGLSREVWYLAIIYLVNRSGEMVIPFMSVYLTNQLGFSKTQTGVVLFCFGLGALIGSNIGGTLTDKIGNFKVMAMSLGGTAVGFICFIFFHDFYMLSGWMVITAIFSSMFSPAAFSAVSIWGHPDNKTRGFSLLRMAINLGVAVGPALGGYLAFNVGYNWLFIVDGITCFFALVTLYILLKHRDVPPSQDKDEITVNQSPYKDVALILFLLFNLINMVAFFQILFAVPVYFKEVVMMDEIWIGLFFTVNGLLVFLLEMPLVYIIEKKNKYFPPLIAGAVLIGIAYFCLSIFNNPIWAIAMYSLLVALGEVINFPLIPSLAMRRANDQNQGKYMGAVSMMFAMAFLLAPMAGLPIVDMIGFQTYWYVAGVLPIISGICLWLLKVYFDAQP